MALEPSAEEPPTDWRLDVEILELETPEWSIEMEVTALLAWRLVDGSGLAADNRTSPEALVAILRHALESPYGAVLLETLPEAGTRQMRRMTRTPAARNLRAKTGTIEGVSALTGLVRTADERPVVFAIVGNDLPSAWGAKRLEDEIGAALAGWSSGAGD